MKNKKLSLSHPSYEHTHAHIKVVGFMNTSKSSEFYGKGWEDGEVVETWTIKEEKKELGTTELRVQWIGNQS